MRGQATKPRSSPLCGFIFQRGPSAAPLCIAALRRESSLLQSAPAWMRIFRARSRCRAFSYARWGVCRVGSFCCLVRWVIFWQVTFGFEIFQGFPVFWRGWVDFLFGIFIDRLRYLGLGFGIFFARCPTWYWCSLNPSESNLTLENELTFVLNGMDSIFTQI